MLSWAAARSQRGASPAGTSPGRHEAARRDREKGDTSKSLGGWGTREHLAQEGAQKAAHECLVCRGGCLYSGKGLGAAVRARQVSGCPASPWCLRISESWFTAPCKPGMEEIL